MLGGVAVFGRSFSDALRKATALTSVLLLNQAFRAAEMAAQTIDI
jgi:hypothetical protein